MANEGYIIVKKGLAEGDKIKKEGFRAFYGPHDKGSAKPSFCYPKQKETLKEDIKGLEKSLSDGAVASTRVLKVKNDLQMRKNRLNEINAQEADAVKLFKENKDSCMQRRTDLADLIAGGMPSMKDVEKRRVNPHRIYEDEKKKGLGKLKLEYQVLSHLADEEANTRFLQRD
ncbi:MAG TPA: hypothetical protein ACFYD4_09345 [Candidatus Wunengus sp. YC61]|uniref:hypothetical protein n=1 Tax=Candidatus Wunengus sp. YC61 TaxID=3367698 RepID=UPI004028B879